MLIIKQCVIRCYKLMKRTIDTKYPSFHLNAVINLPSVLRGARQKSSSQAPCENYPNAKFFWSLFFLKIQTRKNSLFGH